MRGCGGKRGQWSNLAGVEGACKRIGQRLCFNRAAQSCRAVGAARSWWKMEAPSYRVRGLRMPAGLRSLRTRATHSCASAGGTESGRARRLSDVERREEAQKMLAGGESSDSGPAPEGSGEYKSPCGVTVPLHHALPETSPSGELTFGSYRPHAVPHRSVLHCHRLSLSRLTVTHLQTSRTLVERISVAVLSIISGHLGTCNRTC
jgi:hypothetical protein